MLCRPTGMSLRGGASGAEVSHRSSHQRVTLTSTACLYEILQTWTLLSLCASDDTQTHLVMVRLAREIRHLHVRSSS